ncbi:MAG TPA: pyridoxamine 5'-phosphate oxidase family protein [Bacteroidales bacterium]|nr:pyridoxamine 5'-phosphate oxidase family protein [Bacteroidales bacterium]HXK80751.1 pyridoxamine 5'-phosphate oxidase family protein [Bacteroidales bacterium]
MKLPSKRILKFVRNHHVLTLATSVDDSIWCASCFYAFDEKRMCFIFTSDIQTKHAEQANNNSNVAGNIHLETKIIGKIRGIQFSGRTEIAKGDVLKYAKKKYLIRFPFAILAKTAIWILYIDYIKMTDNSLSFGKKLKWSRSDEY